MGDRVIWESKNLRVELDEEGDPYAVGTEDECFMTGPGGEVVLAMADEIQQLRRLVGLAGEIEPKEDLIQEIEDLNQANALLEHNNRLLKSMLEDSGLELMEEAVGLDPL
jgi:hypothetical protein